MIKIRLLILTILLALCITTTVEAMGRCPKCLRQYSNSASFCIKDGNRLKAPSTMKFIHNKRIQHRSTLRPGVKIGDVRTNPRDNAMMVWVPKGKFWMGSTDAQIAKVLNEAPTLVREWYDNEQPLHTVYLSGYWIYKYEVTVAQYRKFCTKTGRLMPIAPDWRWIDSHPIVNVSWQDASAYAKWAEASLPTEAQWEKAARGTDGRIFPWGNQFDTSKCNESSKELLRTQPVGSYPDGASPYGCMDMAGNAWEYCSDWYSADYYAKSPFRNPTGPKKGIEHSLRGGSWWDNMVNNERCSRRARILPASSDYHSGFRCVRVR